MEGERTRERRRGVCAAAALIAALVVLLASPGSAFAGPATHFAVSAPASATAGTAFSFTVTALDSSNATATSYSGTVHFTSGDGNAVLPANSTLTNGVGTFSATLKTAGNQTVTATDTITSSITGTSNTIGVSAAAATHFAISAPASATAGSAFSFTVTALDQFNNTATGYGGTVHVTSSDPQAALPANFTLASGVRTVSATLKTAGVHTLTGSDTLNGAVTGTSNSISVSPAAANHFIVSAPASATAGSAFSFTTIAVDQFGNTATGYSGTVHFTSSDGNAVLPADSTLTNGVGTFSATLKTAGVQTISAKDTLATSITGTSGGTAVNPAAATHFAVSAPAAAAAQTAFQVTVTALDQFNNTATGYAGTVHFTSSDGSATLPANATLTSGVRTFAVTLRTIGSRTVTATDTFSVSITGTSGAITVGPAVTHFAVSAPASATAGSPISFTVTALDASNQVAPGYSGTIHFTSTDGAAAVPGDGTISGGTGTLSATLHTVGNRTITATDSAAASITGTSGTIAVGPGPVARFAISAPASISAGKQFAFTVTALDSSGNTATGYAGTAHFTSSDPHAALPAAHALAGGSGSFTAALATGGNQSITATDGPATGSSAAIAVSGSVAAPRIAKLAVGTVCGRARRGGLRTTFKVDQPGTVTLTIARRVGGALSTCPRNRKLPKGRYKSVKTFSFSVGSGTKKLALAATSKHRPLAPGVYELVIRAKNAFNEQSRVARVPFWVLKAH